MIIHNLLNKKLFFITSGLIAVSNVVLGLNENCSGWGECDIDLSWKKYPFKRFRTK